MNRDLAKYILSLKDEISLRIWLSAIGKSARNGTANLMYKDLMLENRLTRTQLDKYFNPYEAERMEVIKILARSDNFISVNFRAGTKQKAGPQQLKLMAKAVSEETDVKTTALTTTSNLLPAETDLDKDGLLTKIPKNYNPTHKLIQFVISDYIDFFKQLQVDKAAFIGKTLEFEHAVKPQLDGKDIKPLRELAKHFSTISGISNENMIRRSFIQIYLNWWNFTDFIKNGEAPRQILFNINKIIPELINLKNTNGKTTDKRENELNSKIKRAQSKDYSHLAKTRKKDN